MPSLDELLNSGLGGIISGGGLPTEEALYQRQALAERESTNARGLGISSVTRDALAKARMDAALTAQQAQLAALGQAASVTQANANRVQQESQFGRSLAQQKRALGQQKDIANTQMLAGGVGAGAGALASLGGAAFGPELRTGLRGFFGRPPLLQDSATTPGGGGTTMPSATTPTMPTFDAGAGAGAGGGPSLADFGGGGSFQAPDLGSSADWSNAFSMPDLSSLFNYQPDYTSWAY